MPYTLMIIYTNVNKDTYYQVNGSSDKITKIMMVENLTSYIILNKAHPLPMLCGFPTTMETQLLSRDSNNASTKFIRSKQLQELIKRIGAYSCMYAWLWATHAV